MVCSLEYFKLYTKQKLSISDIPELPDKVFNISAGLTKFTIHNAQFSQEINLRQPTIVCSFILANSEHKRTKIGYFIHLFPKTQLSIIFLVVFIIGRCKDTKSEIGQRRKNPKTERCNEKLTKMADV